MLHVPMTSLIQARLLTWSVNSQQIKIPVDDNLEAGKWRVGWQVAELANNNKPNTKFAWTLYCFSNSYPMEYDIQFNNKN